MIEIHEVICLGMERSSFLRSGPVDEVVHAGGGDFEGDAGVFYDGYVVVNVSDRECMVWVTLRLRQYR